MEWYNTHDIVDMRSVLIALVVLPSCAFGFYSPSIGRWQTPDPIEEEGGKNLYVFCRNNSLMFYDSDGRAYFAYRPLNSSITRMTGVWGLNMSGRNWVVAHEQLIFEDGGSPINIGYFDKQVGNPGLDDFCYLNQYIPIPGTYNDCIMRKAVENVIPLPYKFVAREGRKGGQYNCQDYAQDLRNEYYRLLLDIRARCECNLQD